MMASRPSSNIPKDKMDPDGDAPTSDSTNYLKFGKKIYFAESSSSKSPPPRPPTQADNPSSPAGRKGKGSVAQPPRCQVEGCNVDLTGSKGYYCRHKVCAMHSKSPRVVVANIAQRFCQQCSRFHELKEFDEGKRSCRRRLSDHNQRRRKPPNPPFSTRFPREYPNQYRGYLDFTCPPPPPPPPPTNRDLWSVTRPVNPFQAPFVHTGSSMFSPGPNPFYLPTENICALSLLSTNDFAVNHEASHHLVSVASYNSNESIGFRANGPDMGPNGPEFGGDEFELALQNNGPDTTGHNINWSDM